jgi:hypothetical protein
MRYIKSINEQWILPSDLIKLERELESEVRDIFIELEDIGYDVKIRSKFKSTNQIRVSVADEEHRRLVDVNIVRDNFEMLLDFITEKYEIIGHEYSYNYIKNEYIKEIDSKFDPYQWIWREDESEEFPEELKYIVKIILKIDFK